MRHLVRSVSGFVLHVVLATVLYRLWLTAFAGCLVLVLVAGVWYRRTHALSPSTHRANAPDAWRDSYFQTVYPRAASPMQSSQPAMPASAPDPVRTTEPAYSFEELVVQPRFDTLRIVGMADTKRRLVAAARDIIGNPECARNGILLFGEPGNGKTMFAEALAGELGVPFFALDYGSVASKWINETPAKVKAAFARPLKLGHGVFFIDELESYVKRRGTEHTLWTWT
jgi:transitional endoplasmic reticulum ATPase